MNVYVSIYLLLRISYYLYYNLIWFRYFIYIFTYLLISICYILNTNVNILYVLYLFTYKWLYVYVYIYFWIKLILKKTNKTFHTIKKILQFLILLLFDEIWKNKLVITFNCCMPIHDSVDWLIVYGLTPYWQIFQPRNGLFIHYKYLSHEIISNVRPTTDQRLIDRLKPTNILKFNNHNLKRKPLLTNNILHGK